MYIYIYVKNGWLQLPWLNPGHQLRIRNIRSSRPRGFAAGALLGTDRSCVSSGGASAPWRGASKTGLVILWSPMKSEWYGGFLLMVVLESLFFFAGDHLMKVRKATHCYLYFDGLYCPFMARVYHCFININWGLQPFTKHYKWLHNGGLMFG